MTINCAIIGCGQIAGGYDSPSDTRFIRTHAKAILDNPTTKLVAVCDTDAAVAAKFASDWGASNFYQSLEELLSKHELGLLCISTPTSTHLPILKKALEAKVPKIWLEKPAANNLSDLEEMINVSKSSSSDVYINYFRRYDEGFKKVKELINSEKVLSATAYYTKGFSHNASHLLNLLHWWFGEIKSYENLNILPCSDYPSLSLSLAYENAKVDIKAFDHNSFEIFELDLILEKSRIRILNGGQEIEFYQVTESLHYENYYNFNLRETHRGSYGQFMKEGLSSVLKGELINTLEEELAIRSSIERIESEAGINRE